MSSSPQHRQGYNGRLPHMLERAALLCEKRNGKFTTIRRLILENLLQADQALGAYDIQARMKDAGMHLKPPTIYRALEFLTAFGLAHRIESLNAYVACSHCGDAFHQPGFFICRRCGLVDEVILTELAHGPLAPGFRVERTVYEVQGLCEQCDQANTHDRN